VTASQQSQMIIEAVGDFRSGKNANPCRGQLDSQRDAVHPANDRLNRSSDILVQLEPWLHVTGPVSKKPGRIRCPCFTSVAALLYRQRRHWPYQLPAMSSGARLVPRIATDGHLRNTTSATRRAAPRTCSQQSSTSSAFASRR